MRNKEFMDFTGEQTERKMTGEITLYFQGGCIESARTSERYTKTELQAQVEARRKTGARVLLAKK